MTQNHNKYQNLNPPELIRGFELQNMLFVISLNSVFSRYKEFQKNVQVKIKSKVQSFTMFKIQGFCTEQIKTLQLIQVNKNGWSLFTGDIAK